MAITIAGTALKGKVRQVSVNTGNWLMLYEEAEIDVQSISPESYARFYTPVVSR